MTSEHPRENSYETAPEHEGDVQGYEAADPDPADEGYTSEGVMKHRHEQTDQNPDGE